MLCGLFGLIEGMRVRAVGFVDLFMCVVVFGFVVLGVKVFDFGVEFGISEC